MRTGAPIRCDDLVQIVAWFRKWHSHRCFYCGSLFRGRNTKTQKTHDHIIPRSAGGSNVKTNRVPCCKSCNESKGSMGIDEFRSKCRVDAFYFERIWR